MFNDNHLLAQLYDFFYSNQTTIIIFKQIYLTHREDSYRNSIGIIFMAQKDLIKIIHIRYDRVHKEKKKQTTKNETHTKQLEKNVNMNIMMNVIH